MHIVGEVVRTPSGTYIRCTDDSEAVVSELDVLDLLTYSGDMESNRLMLEERFLHPDFFDLKTGLAGAIFLKLSTYHVKTAIVANVNGIKSERFRELMFECNRGRQINFYDNVAQAEEWLVA